VIPELPELETVDVQTLWLKLHANAAGKLAVMVSLASLVDPGLLRTARLELKLPVSAEIALRCSPIVSSAGQGGLVLADEVLPELRGQLVRSEMLALAWELTRARHQAISPALAMEEMLTYQAIAGVGNAGNLAESELNRALVAIVRDQKTQMAAWAARALPRLPESVRELPSGRYLATAAEAHGYRNARTVKTAGAPPAWMKPSRNSQALTGGVSRFGSVLELAFPWRTGDQSLPLPDDRRVWVSWGTGAAQQTQVVTVPNGSAVSLNIFGPEITIEAPGMGKLVLQILQQKPVASRKIFLALPRKAPASPNQVEFAELLRSRMLDDASLSIMEGDASEAVTATADYYIVADAPVPKPFPEELLAQCRPVILLYDVVVLPPTNDPALSSWRPDSRALLNLNCSRRKNWEGAIRQVLATIASPPKPPGILQDVPPRPTPFYRRAKVFEQIRDVLFGSSAAIVNLFGTQGMGRNAAAIDVVNECAVRRHFTGGIFWPRTNHSWPSGAEYPYLVVMADPDDEDFGQAYRTAKTNASLGSAIILLTRRIVQGFPDMPWVDANQWSPTELYELFRLGLAGPDITGLSPETVLLAAGNTAQGTVNLGRLAGVAVRAKQDVVPTMEALADTGSVLAESRRIAIYELDLLEPLAACPPSWPLAHASWSGWSRYFPEPSPVTVSQAIDFFQAAFPQGTLPEEVAKPLRELALPTHRRIVESCEAECGGDWALLPNDGYLLQHFVYHLSHAKPGSVLELIENLDWLLLSGSTSVAGAEEPLRAKTSESPETDRLRLLQAYVDHHPSEHVRRMAQARVLLAHNGPTRWIHVIGLAQYALPDNVLGVSRRIGRELARWGYGLLDGGFSGVDYVTAESFCNQLQLADTDPSQALLHIVGPRGTAQFKLGAVQQLAEADRTAVMIRKADAIVAIGGDGYTLEHCRLAAAAGKPVFPIPGSGGDAANFYASLPGDQARRLEPLNLHLASPRNQLEVARKLIELLPPPISWLASPDDGVLL
jgi:SLOG cluster4 family